MTEQEIERNITWEEGLLGIKLRPQQVEACKDILKTFLIDGIKTYILEAPTGAGKSVIGIVVGNILSKMGKKGYLLTSDLSLQDQHEETTRKLHLDYGNVKGVDNYICTKNKLKHSLGECHARGFTPKVIKSLPCYLTCPYYVAKDHAIRSKTAILNYSYWLIQLDFVKTHMSAQSNDKIFTERDYTIFDEAHKIPDIVQSHFSPRFNPEIAKNIETLDNFLHSTNLIEYKRLESLIYEEEDKPKLVEYLSKILQIYQSYIPKFDIIRKWVDNFYEKNLPLPPTLNTIVSACDFIKDVECKLDDYLDFVKATGIVSMLKNKKSEEELVFNFINEYWLIRKNLLNVSNYRLFMSATLGKQFDEMIGLDEPHVYKSLDSDFEFKNCDIWFYPGLSLNFKSKNNYPKLVSLVDRILKIHSKERGIIHTANYEIMEYIVEHSKYKNRFLTYKGSKEKDEALARHKISINSVLMGPSIFEGLDLKDDLSRFQIIAKIPYPSLGDTFVKYKFDNNRAWYQWTTQLKIQQALGRSIRDKTDSAVSYILDSNLIYFVDNFPEYITNRMKVMEDEDGSQ